MGGKKGSLEEKGEVWELGKSEMCRGVYARG